MSTDQRRRSERGEATTEMVLAVPVLMLLILIVIQFGLWYHASHVAESAAQEGARAARLHDATNEDGVNRARQFIDAAASSLLSDVDVSVARDTETVRGEVQGKVQAIIPGISLPVSAEAESPIESFRGDP